MIGTGSTAGKFGEAGHADGSSQMLCHCPADVAQRSCTGMYGLCLSLKNDVEEIALVNFGRDCGSSYPLTLQPLISLNLLDRGQEKGPTSSSSSTAISREGGGRRRRHSSACVTRQRGNKSVVYFADYERMRKETMR